MKILAFCPFELDNVAGNVITLRRVEKALAARGHRLEIVTVTPETDARAAARKVAPDVIHYYHAFKTGRLRLDDYPSVVTVSGTDLNLDWDDPEKRPVIAKALEGAGWIVTYNASLAEKVRKVLPKVEAKLWTIAKGVDAGSEPYDLRGAAGAGPGDVLFFHPAGIRPVKNNLFALEGLRDLGVKLVFAGEVLDPFYGKMFRQVLSEAPWARHLPNIPHACMLSALRGADVVLNTSQAEGISNALMEAMLAGRAILASNIAGNRDLIQDGVTGLLYHKGNFEAQARRLLDPALRESLGRAAAAFAEKNFSVDREAQALLAAYEAARRALSI